MNPALVQLEAAAGDLGLRVSSTALGLFDRYLREVLAWRGRTGLTSARTAQELIRLHFTDSLTALAACEYPPDCRVVDVGSGAGFPGLPVKIVRPDIRLTLVEASRRRAAFLEHLRSRLDLPEVEVVWARAEEFGHRSEGREAFDRSLERATSRMGVAAELCLPLVDIGGAALFLKGPSVLRELAALGPLIGRLGGRVESCDVRTLPATDRRRAIVVLRKVSQSPPGLPRRGPRLGRPP